ncbi:hypothetical protein D3C71_2119270 [compost metagenome]
MTPSAATSFASVFDQPTMAERIPLESASCGIGCSTPDEVRVMIRPHFFVRIAGSSRPVR